MLKPSQIEILDGCLVDSDRSGHAVCTISSCVWHKQLFPFLLPSSGFRRQQSGMKVANAADKGMELAVFSPVA